VQCTYVWWPMLSAPYAVWPCPVVESPAAVAVRLDAAKDDRSHGRYVRTPVNLSQIHGIYHNRIGRQHLRRSQEEGQKART
jgi:hypothetical protein